MKRLLYLVLFLLVFIPEILAENLIYKKIVIDSETDLEQIQNNVAEILVTEPTFLLVRIEKNKTIPNTLLLPAQESDFIQRDLKIYFHNKQELEIIQSAGIDIWHKEKQIIIGRAFDSQIKKLQAVGILVEKR